MQQNMQNGVNYILLSPIFLYLFSLYFFLPIKKKKHVEQFIIRTGTNNSIWVCQGTMAPLRMHLIAVLFKSGVNALNWSID